MDKSLVETALKSLADIAVPAPVSYLPQTWGWAVVALLALAMLALLGWRWYRHWKANRYRRAALAELRLLEKRSADDAAFDQALATLLKRTALAAWPRTDVASLSGSRWSRFLAEHGPGGVLDEPLAALVDMGEYRKTPSGGSRRDRDARLRAARHWIEAHHVSA